MLAARSPPMVTHRPPHDPRDRGFRFATALCAALGLLLSGVLSAAELSYPSRPVHIIVPQAAGGAVDVVARMLGERISAGLGATVVVENKPGANGIIGTEAVKDAAPDGYTLLAASSSTHAMAPHTTPHIPYDALRDFAPVVNIAYTTKVVMVSPALPVRTLKEFIDYARVRPGTLNYGSTGVGSSTHLDVEMFCLATGIRLVHVPYRGAPQANQALANDEIQLVIGSLTTARGLLQSGRVRALGIVSDRRTELLPDVPTVREQGFPEYRVETWIGLVAPSGTPPAIVQILNRAVNESLRDPSMRRSMQEIGLESIGGSSRRFDEQIRSDYAMWGEVARRLALQPE